jgi:hypothetical protein
LNKHTNARRLALIKAMAELAELAQAQAAALSAFRAEYKRKLNELERASQRLEVATGETYDYSYPEADSLTDPDELLEEARSWRELARRV